MAAHHDPEELKEAGLTEQLLRDIRQDFVRKRPEYEQTAQYLTNVLLKTAGVHSVRYRVKDPLHLSRKIIRKKLDNKERNITLATYEEEITDLAGIRILHLFKSDWERIHHFIMKTWEVKEKPTAYYREGDSPEFLRMFAECDIKEHPYGYRSVHYIIETSPTKAKRYVELQVRTIFEEGWSEIDHTIRYPNFSDNPLTNNLLMILNRLAGSADEMSSFVQQLSIHLEKSKEEFEKMQQERDEQIAKLHSLIENPDTSKQIKSTLEGVANSISHSIHFKLSDDFIRAFAPLHPDVFKQVGAGALGNLFQTKKMSHNLESLNEAFEKLKPLESKQKKGKSDKSGDKPDKPAESDLSKKD